jgi:hypothetical protein
VVEESTLLAKVLKFILYTLTLSSRNEAREQPVKEGKEIKRGSRGTDAPLRFAFLTRVTTNSDD